MRMWSRPRENLRKVGIAGRESVPAHFPVNLPGVILEDGLLGLKKRSKPWGLKDPEVSCLSNPGYAARLSLRTASPAVAGKS